MPSVHYLSVDVLSRAGVRRPPRTAREISTNIRRDPDYFCFPGEARERRAARGDGDGIPRPGILLGTASTPKTPRERKKGSPASVFDFDTHVSSSKNDAEESAVAVDVASNAASSRQDRSEQLQLEPEQVGGEVNKLGGFEVGQNVWVRVGEAHNAEHPAVIVSLWDGGGSNTARVRWTTSNKVDEVKVEQLVSMFGGGDSPAHGRSRGRETIGDVQDTDGCEMLAGPAEMAKMRHKGTSPDEEVLQKRFCPKVSQACAECRRIKQKCVVTPPNKECDRCISRPGLVCCFDSPQEKSSDTVSKSRTLRKKSAHLEKMDTPVTESAMNNGEETRKIPLGSVCRQRNETWSVLIPFRGKRRYMGLFQSKQQAALAREAAHAIFVTGNGSTDKIVESAKAAAKDAVREEMETTPVDPLESSDSATILTVDGNHSDQKEPAILEEPRVQLEEQQANGRKPTQSVNSKKTEEEVVAQLHEEEEWHPSRRDYALGVRQVPSGKWRVEITYQGKRRSIGTFATRDEALVANEAARILFQETNASKLSEEEAQKNALVAREAAKKAVAIAQTEPMAANEAVREEMETAPMDTLESIESQAVEVVAQSDGEKEEPPFISNRTEGASNVTWVECDRCKKWRRLRGVVNASELPSQWHCSMNNDPDFAQCSAPEEVLQQEYDIPESMSEPQKETTVNYWTCGVRRVVSGNWQVEFRYQGKPRCIGTFATKGNAAVANETARKLLNETRASKLSDEEAKKNVLAAREAAIKAVTIAQTAKPGGNRLLENAASNAERTHVRTRDVDSSIPMLDSKAAKKKTPGVRKVRSGNWKVEIKYQGKMRTIGTFATRDEALVANEAARKLFQKTNASKLSEEEAQMNVLAAREAAKEAVVIANQHSRSTRPCHQCGFLLQHNQTHCAKCLAAADATESSDSHSEPMSSTAHENGRLAEEQTSFNDEDSDDEEWLCDVCQTARFSTMDEAVQHERTCRNVPSPEPADELRTHVATDELPLQETDLVVEVAATETSVPGQADEYEPESDKPANTAFWDPLASRVNEALDQNNAVALSAANAPKEIWHEPVAETPTPLPRPGWTRPCDQCGFLMLHNQTDCAACRRPPKRQSAEDGLLHSKRKNDDTVARAQQPLAFAHAIARSRQLYNLQRMATVPNPRSLGQTLISKDAPWFYVDTQDSVQGPFPGYQMRRWLDGGHFNDRLRISQNRGGPYSTLSSYFPDRDVAFTGLVPRVEAVESEEEKLLSRRRKGARQEAARRRGEEEARRTKNALETRRKVDDEEIARRRNAENRTRRVRTEVEEAQQKAGEAAKARQERRIADAEEYQKAKRKEREEAEQAPQLSHQPGGHASAEMTLEDTSLGAELRRCALETCPDGPKLLLDEQPLEEFEAWLSNRKAKWGRGQTKGSLDEALLDVEILRCEAEADRDGPTLLLHEQPKEDFNAWLSHRKRKWGRLGEKIALPESRKRRKPQTIVRKTFSERVNDLKAYKEKHGHLDVHMKEDKSLHYFIANVRQGRSGRGGGISMTVDRISSLDAIGFDWRLPYRGKTQRTKVEFTEDTLLELEIHRCVMEAGRDGSNLLPGRSQPKEEFDAWLAEKKERWRRE